MATFTKYQNFVKDLCSGIHDFSTHTVQVAVTADTPIAASDSVYADTSALGDVNGYVSGGYTVAVSLTTSGGSVAIVGTDVSFTATGAGVQFRDVDDYRDVESEYTETIGDIHPTVKRFCVCQGSFRKSVLHCVR